MMMRDLFERFCQVFSRLAVACTICVKESLPEATTGGGSFKPRMQRRRFLTPVLLSLVLAVELGTASAQTVGVAAGSGQQEGEARTATLERYQVVRVDAEGHGLLARCEGKQILIVAGTPEQMGQTQGRLLAPQIRYLVERVLFGVGAFDTLNSGVWFLSQMEEIQRRTSPFIPERYFAEIDAMADGAKIPRRDARFANLFPERFHCSGVAVRGKASKGGQIIHARVLDYMRDINLQACATVQVFIPEGRHAWISHGYAGLVGTVTAMNEAGLAVGEMGGRGEGDWDGMPMTLLLREIMERARSVQEALKILQETPRTCEYYYVFSDRSGELAAVRAVPNEVLILRPGEQHPLLPPVPEDTVFISGDERAKVLSDRLFAGFGQIDVPAMIEIIKRPVAMRSNLHNAIMLPQSLDMWVADAGRTTPACDEPYVRVNLGELLQLYRQTVQKERPAP